MMMVIVKRGARRWEGGAEIRGSWRRIVHSAVGSTSARWCDAYDVMIVGSIGVASAPFSCSID